MTERRGPRRPPHPRPPGKWPRKKWPRKRSGRHRRPRTNHGHDRGTATGVQLQGYGSGAAEGSTAVGSTAVGLTLGVDIGGTKVLGGVVDPDGRVVAQA